MSNKTPLKNQLFEDLKSGPEYKHILEKMSDEERAIAEKAIADMLEQFERTVLAPLKKLQSQ